jgi:diguanylate cyclase (GGDEF)-like protein
MASTHDKITDTWVTPAPRPARAAASAACLVRIYPTGPGMGARYSLSETPVVLGRDRVCDVHLDDHSVSRKHARIQSGMDGHYAVDLQSTNGTFVNDRPASMTKLRDGDYLRVGNWIFRYLAGGNLEAEYHEEIYRLTIIDALTGIHNKRFLLEFLDRELARSARHQRPLALVLLDLDHFKNVNERHGHLGGDYTLREMAACVKEAIRKEELFARYGGEEFAIVLPETTREGAVELAERIRGLVESHPFTYEDELFHITVSLGVYATLGDEALTPNELIRRADEQLFLAKDAGRNRTCFTDAKAVQAAGLCDIPGSGLE